MVVVATPTPSPSLLPPLLIPSLPSLLTLATLVETVRRDGRSAVVRDGTALLAARAGALAVLLTSGTLSAFEFRG